MARPLRIQAPGLTYHVTARGTGRMAIYLDETDRRSFLEHLADVTATHDLTCHAYCLMTTHYHLVATTARANLSKAVKQLNGGYAQRWNRRHDRVGHVFQGRFGAQVVQHDAYFAVVCRYVVLNPVRAGLVEAPDLWPWSSYGATAGLAPVPSFLRPEQLLTGFGGADRASGVRRYRRFVAAIDPGHPKLPAGPLLGDDAFAESFKRWAAQSDPEIPRRQRRAPPPLDTLFAGVVSRQARAERMEEAYRAGHAMVDIARYLGVHYATVSKAIAGVRRGVRS